jgi:hypothetical protein
MAMPDSHSRKVRTRGEKRGSWATFRRRLILVRHLLREPATIADLVAAAAGHIDVKWRAALRKPAVLTPKEWLRAGRHGESYWLYVVSGCKTDTQQLITIQYPVHALGAQAQPLVEVKRWLLKADSLKSSSS